MSRKRKNLGFVRDFEFEKRDDDLQLLTTIEKQVQGVLGEVQYITETIDTHKKIAPVEDIEAKIKESYKKIKKLMNSENVDPSIALEGNANRRTSGGIDVEKNPLIKEMGGMPLENISSEWREQIEGKILDKAELENLVNKKLKNRAKLANQLKEKNKLKSQPKMRAGQQITPKFKKIQMQETLKYILKEEPKPIPAPKPPPVPRPFGYG
ncbi:MAG: hypothetical protein KBD03_05145 [Gammaproteobacteria bacterium]|jgi:hypothetical protein|nr:hypothetical protein [Gammaproteobacteria bacterium]